MRFLMIFWHRRGGCLATQIYTNKFRSQTLDVLFFLWGGDFRLPAWGGIKYLRVDNFSFSCTNRNKNQLYFTTKNYIWFLNLVCAQCTFKKENAVFHE